MTKPGASSRNPPGSSCDPLVGTLQTVAFAKESAAVPRSPVATVESLLGACVEIVAASLVGAEILILFAGVVSRYVFDRPLVWSDELASTLFLWLAMLGAVIAFRRDEHMRMTACVGLLSPPWRAALDMFAGGAALAFLLLIAWPTYQYAVYQAARSPRPRLRSPTLGVPRPCRPASS